MKRVFNKFWRFLKKISHRFPFELFLQKVSSNSHWIYDKRSKTFFLQRSKNFQANHFWPCFLIFVHKPSILFFFHKISSDFSRNVCEEMSKNSLTYFSRIISKFGSGMSPEILSEFILGFPMNIFKETFRDMFNNFYKFENLFTKLRNFSKSQTWIGLSILEE